MHQDIHMETIANDGQNYSQIQLKHQVKQQESYLDRHKFRQSKLQSIKDKLENQTQDRSRQKQGIFLYLLNLALPFTLCYLNSYILLDLTDNKQFKCELIIIFVTIGFMVSLYSCLKIAPWREVLRLYFHFDSMVAVLMSANIGFFSLLLFGFDYSWEGYGYCITFPIWVVYYAGSLRVMIAYLDWERWEILVYKIVIVACALIYFYVGYTYMNGAYKITEGYLTQMENTFKNVVYLYVFGMVELYFQYFRVLSSFDQTKDLKFQYKFTETTANQSKLIAKIEFQALQIEVIKQDLQDQIQVRSRQITQQLNYPAITS